MGYRNPALSERLRPHRIHQIPSLYLIPQNAVSSVFQPLGGPGFVVGRSPKCVASSVMPRPRKAIIPVSG